MTIGRSVYLNFLICECAGNSIAWWIKHVCDSSPRKGVRMGLSESKLIGVAIRILSFLWLLLAVVTYARAERLPIKAYTTADGLANNRIGRILRDSHGFMWFCTANGLS